MYGRVFDPYDYSTHVFAFHEYQAIYFAVPKVANSSLKTAFWDLFPAEVREAADVTQGKRRAYTLDDNRELLFSTGSRILKHQTKRYPHYFTFAFVRSPWDRLVSCYSDKILSSAVLEDGSRDVEHRAIHDRAGLPENMEFDEFARRVARIPDRTANRHFRSQHTFLCDRNLRLLPDFIGRYERLGEDFAAIQERLHTPRLELPRVRRSERRPFQEYYTDDLRRIVAERYQTDISMFGYSFDDG
jgi:hypothetical protein